MIENPEQERALRREMVKSHELPGRGFNIENLPGERSETINELGYPKTDTIRDPEQIIMRDGKQEQAKVWEKRWDYKREQGPDNQWRDTEEVMSITEIEREYSNNGQTELERGRHQMREHDWETLRNFDERGTLTKEAGKVTAGEKKGEHWEVNIERTQVGSYTEIVETTTGERAVTTAGQTILEAHRTVKVQYRNADNTAIFGWKQTEGDPASHHSWGVKPVDLLPGQRLREPLDFFNEKGEETEQ